MGGFNTYPPIDQEPGSMYILLFLEKKINVNRIAIQILHRENIYEWDNKMNLYFFKHFTHKLLYYNIEPICRRNDNRVSKHLNSHYPTLIN